MRVLIQRSQASSVVVKEKQVGSITHGIVLLVGFTHTDTLKDIEILAEKVINLRIFDDDNGIMNKSLLDIKGSILSISQFTLYADTKKGRRPSYQNALSNEQASRLYDIFNEKLRENVKVETGVFGSKMQLNITNDGPVTILLES